MLTYATLILYCVECSRVSVTEGSGLHQGSQRRRRRKRVRINVNIVPPYLDEWREQHQASLILKLWAAYQRKEGAGFVWFQFQTN